MTTEEIIQKATNPQQYDSEDVFWNHNESIGTPTRNMVWSYLSGHSRAWQGKSVLEIGAGTGWLMDAVRKSGAASVLGLEPSRKNAASSGAMFPGLDIVPSTWEAFQPAGMFDVVMSVLAISHVRDADGFFRKVAGLLNEGGQAIIVTMNFDYYRTPRFGYTLDVRDVDADTYVVNLTSKDGNRQLADLVVGSEALAKAAERNGLRHVATEHMTPTQELMAAKPQYLDFKGKPVFDLIIFSK